LASDAAVSSGRLRKVSGAFALNCDVWSIGYNNAGEKSLDIKLIAK